MNRKPRFNTLGFVLIGGTILPLSAQAGGIVLYEMATPDLGLAAAGYAARAQDPSTVFSNPAGMNRLAGSQFQAGLQVLYGSVEFSPHASTTVTGGDGGNAIGALPAGSLFFTQALSDRLAVGFGSCSYFGLAEEYDDQWVGRYYAQKNTLLGLSLMPAVSVKAADWLSIGAGLNAMYGYLDNELAVRTRLNGTDDGQMKLHDETWGFGANVGWQNWDQFGQVDVGVDSANPQSLTANLNYQDTWHGAIGAQYRATEQWLLSTGFAYDTSAVSGEYRTFSLPMGENYRFGLGAQWQVNKAVSLGTGYEFMWAGDMPVTQSSLYRGHVSGRFNDSWFSFFDLHLTWTF